MIDANVGRRKSLRRKRREETLKYLALYFIKAGVVTYNHHGTRSSYHRQRSSWRTIQRRSKLSEKTNEDIQWILHSAKALCEVLVTPFFV